MRAAVRVQSPPTMKCASTFSHAGRPNLCVPKCRTTPLRPLSYQRRTHALKSEFLVRHRETPLGVTIATWDRTEAQTREALHGHILNWNKRRKLSAENYTPRPAIELRVPDADNPKKVPGGAAPDMNAEDDVYYRTETARVLAELVRPILPEDETRRREVLLWAFLLRCVQTLLYVHACTQLYGLKNRPAFCS